MGKMTYPKIKLIIDAAKDAELGVDFFKYTRGELKKEFLWNFFPDELYNVINKKMSSRTRNNLIRTYAQRIHREKQKEIIKGVQLVKKEWVSVEKKYFQLVDRIFDCRPWPKGTYRGFATVFYAYPRNISGKIFYFPHAHRLPRFANKVIAHEMLHFMFFDYMREKYGLKEQAQFSGRPHDYLWRISEAFNNAIQRWKPYQKVFRYGSRPYSGTEALAAQMTSQWAREQNVEKLLDRYFL